MKNGIEKASSNFLEKLSIFQKIRKTYIDRFTGVNLKNQSELDDKIPRIPEILKSQIIKMVIVILFFEIICFLKLILKQFYQRANKVEYHPPDEHYHHKNRDLKFAD